MKRFSIKANVIIWYTGLLFSLTSIILIYVFISTNHVVIETSKENIKKIVNSSMNKIKQENENILVDKNMLYYNAGVSILIYNENDELYKGEYPMGFLPRVPLKHNHIQIINSETDKWLVYDSNKKNGITVRGISPLNLASETIYIAISNILLALPFFIIIAALGGIFITKKAFKPIDKIIETANSINNGNDLSKRINLKKASGEVAKLGQTFDSMFDRLEDSFEKEKHFTSDASHELRTPVSVIISQSEYALESDNEKEIKSCIKIILQQGKLMSSCISQLLMFTRADKGVEVASFEKINISELIDIIIEELSYNNEKKDIKLLHNIEDNIFIKGDQTLITRMIINIISNGINYSKKTGYVKIDIFKKNSNVYINISDNGIGICEDDLNKIWNRFYRAEKSRNKSSSLNLGLGLPMVKWIVNIHGGEIHVKSKLDIGSKFSIILPLYKEKQD